MNWRPRTTGMTILFEITRTVDKIVRATHARTNISYPIQGLPAHLLKSPLLIHGVTGKMYNLRSLSIGCEEIHGNGRIKPLPQ
ncbi:MAG: hypothetical protein ACQEUT_16625 [Bacillota bacterium]